MRSDAYDKHKPSSSQHQHYVSAPSVKGSPPTIQSRGVYGSRSPSPHQAPTGAQILGHHYSGDFKNFSERDLLDADRKLRDMGYVFAGFKGAPQDKAVDAVNNGLRARMNSDWSGLYVADSPKVAAGYTVDDNTGNARGGQIVRVYVPAQDADHLVNINTPLSNEHAAKKEFADTFRFPIGTDRSYAIRGYESEDRSSKETILSGKVAARAVAIPSTIHVNQRFGGDIESYPSTEHHLSRPPPGRNSAW